MGKSTDYSINLYYKLRDEASRGLDRMAAKAKSTSNAFGGLKTAVATYFGGRTAYNALIKFNDGVEQTKIQIGGMMALAKQTPFTRELGNANKMYDALSRKAASLPGTTKDYVDMLGMIAQPASNAGLSMRKLEDLTVGATVASKALGIQADVGARDIGQALRGQYNSKDQLTGAILGSIGYAGEEGRAKFNALSDAKRASELMRAFKQKQLTEMAAAQGNTWGGMMSTAVDAAQRFFGKVGLQLFERVKKELAAINRWLTVHESQVEAFAKDLGDGLVTGFKAVKEVAKFIVDNRDTFMTIGKVWLATKAAGAIGNFAGGVSGGAVAGSKLGKAASAAIPAAQAIAIGWSIGQRIGDALNETQLVQSMQDAISDAIGNGSYRRNKAREDEITAWDQQLTINQAEFKQRAIESGMFGKLGKMAELATNDKDAEAYAARMESLRVQYGNRMGLIASNDTEVKALKEKMTAQLSPAHMKWMPEELRKQILAGVEADSKRIRELELSTSRANANMWRDQFAYVHEAWSQIWPEVTANAINALKAPFEGLGQFLGLIDKAKEPDKELFSDKNKQAKGGDTHVTINRIEVASEDPDRFVFGLEEIGKRANQARIRARGLQ